MESTGSVTVSLDSISQASCSKTEEEKESSKCDTTIVNSQNMTVCASSGYAIQGGWLSFDASMGVALSCKALNTLFPKSSWFLHTKSCQYQIT